MTECFVPLYVALYATEKQPHLYAKSLEDSNINHLIIIDLTTVADAPVLPVCCRWKPPKVLGEGILAFRE